LANTTKQKVTFDQKFLKESKLARLATVSPSGQPHVVPIAFEFEGEFYYFGGYNITKSLRFKNLQRNNKVGLVADDLISTMPWTPHASLSSGALPRSSPRRLRARSIKKHPSKSHPS